MKTFFLISAAIVFFCNDAFSLEKSFTLNDTLEIPKKNTEENDSTEYELQIFDSGFDTWMAQKAEPIGFYKQSYLERWNATLVNQWNNEYGISYGSGCGPQTYIDYDPSVDYGKELNYTLFHYFWYMHESCNIFTHKPSQWR